MKHIIIVFFLFTCQQGFTQDEHLKYNKQTTILTYKDSSVEYQSAVANNLITNRDYLTYILWNNRVYGADYPEVLLENIQGYTLANNYYYSDTLIHLYLKSNNPIEFILNNSGWIVKDYMLNPKFIDYPVLGLSKQQTLKYCKWLSDRYNEYTLIKNKELKFNMFQINEDCFISESFEANQFEGLVSYRYKEHYSWTDNLLLSSFRLPTNFEFKKIKQNEIIIQEQKSIKFLKPWQDALFKVDSKGMEIITIDLAKNLHPYIPFSDTLINFDSLNIKEIKISEKHNNYLNAYLEMGYDHKPDSLFRNEYGYYYDKDSLGFMNFLVIGLNENGIPIQIEADGFNRVLPKKKSQGELKVFRYAVTLKHIR
tara:strand:- start:101 stop:1204 length:1104 start_codon:yes stop_codon:yes gene_type:complete